MDYRVEIVEDHELPDGTDWAITHEPGRSVMLVRRSVLDCPRRVTRMMEEAWAASRAYPPLSPRQMAS